MHSLRAPGARGSPCGCDRPGPRKYGRAAYTSPSSEVSSIERAESTGPYAERSTKRRLTLCTGRAFIGYSFAKLAMSAAATSIGFVSISQLTVSLHGGVVSEPE